MPAPTQPTPTLIVTEAFRQFGNSSPSAAQISTAISEGIEKVKRDIWAIGKKWRLLRTTQFLPLKVGVSRYANPTDYEQDLQEPGMVIFDGTSRGSLQAAASGTATLASSEAAQQSQAEGHLLAILSGTGTNQAEQIDDYNTTSKLATMRSSWGTTPAASDTYLIVDSTEPVQKAPWARRSLITDPFQSGKPSSAYEMAAGVSGYIELYPVPDKIYMLRRDYYANLLLVDTSVSLYNTIMRNWAGVFTAGVLAWLATHYDDTRAREVKAEYLGLIKHMQARELDEYNESNLKVRVMD